jgi:hypothetical protein
MRQPQYRQGDVLLVRVAERDLAEARRIERIEGRIILAYGEVTGHAHAIDAALAELFEERDGTLYLKLDGPAALTHEEHGAIELDPGIYRVVRQREYSPEAIRQVAD